MMSELREALSELKKSIRENTDIPYDDYRFVMKAINELIKGTLDWEKAQQAAVPSVPTIREAIVYGFDHSAEGYNGEWRSGSDQEFDDFIDQIVDSFVKALEKIDG